MARNRQAYWRRRFSGGLLAAALAVAATSCSSAPAHPPTPTPVRPSAAMTSLPTGSPTLAPPALQDFPAEDTPINSASLSAELRATWTAYDVTIVPGRGIFSASPPSPLVRNRTGGAVSDSDAALWVSAEMRTNQYIGWMAANDQPMFNRHLRSDVFLAGPIGQALHRGEKVTAPPCDLYAATVAVVPVDDAVRALIAQRGETTNAAYALVMRFTGPCAVTGDHGEVLVSIPANGGVTIETGAVRNDPVLGEIWYSDAGAECPASGAPAVCGEVS